MHGWSRRRPVLAALSVIALPVFAHVGASEANVPAPAVPEANSPVSPVHARVPRRPLSSALVLAAVPLHPAAGSAVRFEVLHPPAGATDFRWHLADGLSHTADTGSSPSIVHKYARAGRRNITVQMTVGSGIRDASINLTVVAPAAQATGRPHTAPQPVTSQAPTAPRPATSRSPTTPLPATSQAPTSPQPATSQAPAAPKSSSGQPVTTPQPAAAQGPTTPQPVTIKARAAPEPAPAQAQPAVARHEAAQVRNPAGTRRVAHMVRAHAAGDPAVTIADFQFTPGSTTVHVGDTITWTNNGPSTHTATANDGSFDTGQLKKGQSASHTFTQAGTFTYFCQIHPFMHGTIVVVAATTSPTVSSPGAPAGAATSPSTGTTGGSGASTGSSTTPAPTASTASAPVAHSALPLTGFDLTKDLSIGLVLLGVGLALYRATRERRA
jgi:plastocyanin